MSFRWSILIFKHERNRAIRIALKGCNAQVKTHDTATIINLPIAKIQWIWYVRLRRSHTPKILREQQRLRAPKDSSHLVHFAFRKTLP